MAYYTQRQERYIRDNYLSASDRDLAARLQKSEQGVKSKRGRMGLYKVEVIEIDRHAEYTLKVSRNFEINSLREYISLGKGGQVAIDRLRELESLVDKKELRIHNSRRKVPLSEIANVYSLSVSGFSNVEISKITGINRTTVFRWIREIQGYKGRNKMLMVLDSRINGTETK